MTAADARLLALASAERIPTPEGFTLAAREIANVLFERALDRLETTADTLHAMGHWPRAVVERELPNAERLTRILATQFAVV